MTLNAYLLSEASTVKIPYLIIGAVVVLVAIRFMLAKLPEVKESDAADAHTGFSLKVFGIVMCDGRLLLSYFMLVHKWEW